MNETVFDQILAGTIPCNKVFENDEVFAFHDVNPQAPIHVLVIPKMKIAGFDRLDSLSPEQAGRYLQGIQQVVQELGLQTDGYRIVFNSGRHGQQTVDYIHAHILGGKQLTWPPG